jgi:hypothetical protein
VRGGDGTPERATPPTREEREKKDGLDVDPSSGRRQNERLELLVNLLIQQADEWGEILKEELTVTDNLGQGGAQVRTTLELNTGEVVYVREAQGGVSRGADGIRRLHLRFLDGRVPTHLIRKQ